MFGKRGNEMGVYIYRLEPKFYNHPIYGEVGVLAYWDKLHWADSREVRAQEKRIAIQNKKWQGKKPKFVVFRWDEKDNLVSDKVYDFSKYPQAVYYDTEPLPLAALPEGVDK